MRTPTRYALVTLICLSVVGGNALAGSCNSKAAHSHEAKVETKATIYGLASEGGFKTLTAAIEAAGLQEALSEKGPFTVFAPTDEAFAKLPEGTVEALLADPEALKQVLLYHVTEGTVLAEDVVKLKKAETLNGQKVAINAKDGVKINDATVIKTDIMAENGVIHVIDTVLIPAEKI
jgi:uncharacterized surface protein with fasciclin (FAS1) repeats